MLKKVLPLLILLVLFPVVSASSCPNYDVRTKSMNLESMKFEISGDASDVEAIEIYVDGQKEVTETRESFDSIFEISSLYEPILSGKEIRLDIILKNGEVCDRKEVTIWNTYCGNGTYAEYANVGCGGLARDEVQPFTEEKEQSFSDFRIPEQDESITDLTQEDDTIPKIEEDNSDPIILNELPYHMNNSNKTNKSKNNLSGLDTSSVDFAHRIFNWIFGILQ